VAYFIVRNSLNPYKAVKFSITFQQQTLKGYEGDNIWTAEVNTTEPSVSGTEIKSEYLHLRTLVNLDNEIEKAVSVICEQIDWLPAIEDLRAPYVTSHFPVETTNVSIESSVVINVEESLPSAGIDLSSIKVMLDSFDITNECDVTGDPYEYKVKWKPSTIVYDTY